jgi:hypothetical protein
MCIFAIWIKRALDVAIERSQHADARMHPEVATVMDQILAGGRMIWSSRR